MQPPYVARPVVDEFLSQRWEDNSNLVVVEGPSGIGKTAAVQAWLDKQVSSEVVSSDSVGFYHFDSGDPVIHSAMRRFGDIKQLPESPWQCGSNLASELAEKRTITVLDGLELKQSESAKSSVYRVYDPAVDAFLRAVNRSNAGLCIVIGRNGYSQNASANLTVPTMPPQIGADLLRAMGVRGDEDDLKRVIGELGGLPASLQILAEMLVQRHRGDVSSRPKFCDSPSPEQLSTNQQLLFQACEESLEWSSQVDLLYLLSVIPRPIPLTMLSRFRTEEVIEGFTEGLIHVTDQQWSDLGQNLIQLGLVRQFHSDRDGKMLEITPVAKDYFQARACDRYPDAMREVCGRLYECNQRAAKTNDRKTRYLLYDAVAYGCLAGKGQLAFSDVYLGKICKDPKSITFFDRDFVASELSAMQVLLECAKDRSPPVLDEESLGIAENTAGYCLRATGRQTEATEILTRSVLRFWKAELWGHAQRAANHLAVNLSLQTRLSEALVVALASVEFALKNKTRQPIIRNRTTVASVFRYAGRLNDSQYAFELASKNSKQLRAFPASRFCAFLMDNGEFESACQHLAALIKNFRDNEKDIAILGQLLTYEAAKLHLPATGTRTTQLPGVFDKTINRLRDIGPEDVVVVGLLRGVEAVMLTQPETFAQAERYLNAADEICGRSEMRMYQIDVLIERCRISVRRGDYQKASRYLFDAEQAIDKTAQKFEPHLSPFSAVISGSPLVNLVKPGQILRYDRHRATIANLQQELQGAK